VDAAVTVQATPPPNNSIKVMGVVAQAGIVVMPGIAIVPNFVAEQSSSSNHVTAIFSQTIQEATLKKYSYVPEPQTGLSRFGLVPQGACHFSDGIEMIASPDGETSLKSFTRTIDP
jgi:hypothetical protein